MESTPNLGLLKPDPSDDASIQDLNTNFDILDEALPIQLAQALNWKSFLPTWRNVTSAGDPASQTQPQIKTGTLRGRYLNLGPLTIVRWYLKWGGDTDKGSTTAANRFQLSVPDVLKSYKRHSLHASLRGFSFHDPAVATDIKQGVLSGPATGGVQAAALDIGNLTANDYKDYITFPSSSTANQFAPASAITSGCELNAWLLVFGEI